MDLNQLDSLIVEQQTSASDSKEPQSQLQSASVGANEYELPPGINYQDEIKSNALKIINGECLIIDLQEKFYQEYLGNEDKYVYLCSWKVRIVPFAVNIWKVRIGLFC